MKKWTKGRSEALPLTIPILLALQANATSGGPTSAIACTFDAICLGLHTGSRCSEYCKGHPTDPNDAFSRVPASTFAHEHAGLPLAFTVNDFSFLSADMTFLPWTCASTASHVRVRFRFDKGGSRNFSVCTFRRLDGPQSAFCPLRAVLRALHRWAALSTATDAPVFCYAQTTTVHFLPDQMVTNFIRQATVTAYPDPNHIYRTRLPDLRTHSIRVTACLILVAAKLPDAIIEHRLRWASSAWKVYVRECLGFIDQAIASSFYCTLSDPDPVPALTAFQASDADDLL